MGEEERSGRYQTSQDPRKCSQGLSSWTIHYYIWPKMSLMTGVSCQWSGWGSSEVARHWFAAVTVRLWRCDASPTVSPGGSHKDTQGLQSRFPSVAWKVGEANTVTKNCYSTINYVYFLSRTECIQNKWTFKCFHLFYIHLGKCWWAGSWQPKGREGNQHFSSG